MGLGGCAVGTAYVSAPERLPAKTLPPLTRPITFDVCQPDAGPAREAMGKRIERALSGAGVQAHLAASDSPVDFTVVLGETDPGPGWSAIVSMLTFSVVPGYLVQLKTLDATVAWRDAQHVETEHLSYQARTYVVIWLPLIVSMDFLWAMADGWTSSKVDDGGFRQMVKRLGDDLRARLGRDGVESPARGGGGVSCSTVLGS
jgi:hypothetical protein